jgi:SagB-type dehydrogenase family enzyme
MNRCRAAALVIVGAFALSVGTAEGQSLMAAETALSLNLPEPIRAETPSLSETLARRRSVRAFTTRSLALAEVATLLWAAQGRTGPDGLRTAPSAGALYPLEVYLAAGNVEGLAPGLYRYASVTHRLERIAATDARRALARATRGQDWVSDAPAIIVITAIHGRTTGKYGERGRRYVAIEAGHAGQNIYLQATALGLGTTAVGAFSDARVKEAAGLGPDEEPLMLYPVGQPK